MAPVILKMDAHCLRCARKIRKAVQNMHGVDDVWVSVDTVLVMVKGASLDASLLRRIQSRTGKPVAVVGDGGAAEDPPAGQMVHLGPTPPPLTGSYPYTYGGYGGGGWAAPALQYVPGSGAGGGNVFPYDARQYGMIMANDAPPACYRDDGPSGCCTMQ